MARKWPALVVLTVVLLTGCASRQASPVEDPSGAKDTSRYTLTSLRGTRDGEQVDVEAVYNEGSQPLTVRMQFKVSPQPKLESGVWTGAGASGGVHDRSVTFLGGQAGPPSIGGSFDLNGPDGKPVYRVNIPLQPLKNALIKP